MCIFFRNIWTTGQFQNIWVWFEFLFLHSRQHICSSISCLSLIRGVIKHPVWFFQRNSLHLKDCVVYRWSLHMSFHISVEIIPPISLSHFLLKSVVETFLACIPQSNMTEIALGIFFLYAWIITLRIGCVGVSIFFFLSFYYNNLLVVNIWKYLYFVKSYVFLTSSNYLMQPFFIIMKTVLNPFSNRSLKVSSVSEGKVAIHSMFKRLNVEIILIDSKRLKKDVFH